MSNPIVQAPKFVTLLGAGVAKIAQIQRSLRVAPILVAADGGAEVALAANLLPEAVIGDFDSLSGESATAIPADRLHQIAEQDSTDFDKALRSIAAPLVVGVGFTGARLDHTLAVMNAMLSRPQNPCILLGEEDVICLLPPRLRIDLAEGTRVSLFPMLPVTGTSTGLHWPIDGLPLAPGPGGISGTSNRATGDPVTIEVDASGLFLLLPASEFETLVQTVADTETHWPAPASGA